MLVSDRYTSQKPVMRDWSRPVLPDWSTPAMGAPPKANQHGKPLFGNTAALQRRMGHFKSQRCPI